MKRRNFCALSLALVATAAAPRRARAALSDELPILSRTGAQLLLKHAEVEEFRSSLRGALLLRGNAGYDQARRIWNGAFDRHPAAIARCTSSADVVQALKFASSHDLLVAVRGGGHSLPGHSVCEGGLMIDLAPMQGVEMNRAKRTARVDPGVLLGTMDRAAQAQGLIVPAGTVSHTGVAGLTLGGGFGRLSRKLGLTIDSLIGADLVTLDGKLRRVDANQNPDLFWAIRGGGGNFGIVTAFEYRAHEIAPKLIGGNFSYPFAQARDVLMYIAEAAARAPDEFWVDPVLECDAQGTRRLQVNLCHCGSDKQAASDIDALRRFRAPTADTVGARPFATLQSEQDSEAPHGRSYYMSGGLVQSIEPGLIDHALACIQLPGAELGKISLTQHGGAVARIASDATAFANRTASHNVVLRARWDNPADAAARTAWQKNSWKGVEPFTRGAYANLNLGDADAKLRGAYGPNLDRLVALKTKYDPTNLLHLNPNIRPRG